MSFVLTSYITDADISLKVYIKNKSIKMAFKETEIEVLTAIQAEVVEKLAVNELV